MEEEFLTPGELIKLLKISRATIDRWRKEGMPSLKIGKNVRFEKNKVLDWIKENKQGN